MSKPVQSLIERGVLVRCAETVEVDDSVDPACMAPGTVIHPGCRIRGAHTSIGPHCVLGEEGPVTLENCQLGEGVVLKGGYFCGATLLDGVSFGSGAHVRPGTLLEEQVSCAHAVGLKQTVLLPYVVLGSLVNFCDCLMAGGRDRQHHSEVGSSYVHFNYTPHRDKATPSLIGDVPRGVMLDQPPIFLGGQGGLVGPVRIAFGTVIPAGTVYRRDVVEPGRLVFGQFSRTAADHTYDPDIYGDIRRILANNLIYLGNLHALHAWYRDARAAFLRRTRWGQACLDGALTRIEEGVRERISRLAELAERMPKSVLTAGERYRHDIAAEPFSWQRTFAERWPAVAARLELREPAEAKPDACACLLSELGPWAAAGASYLEAVSRLGPVARAAGTAWLQAIVDSAAALNPLGE